MFSMFKPLHVCVWNSLSNARHFKRKSIFTQSFYLIHLIMTYIFTWRASTLTHEHFSILLTYPSRNLEKRFFHNQYIDIIKISRENHIEDTFVLWSKISSGQLHDILKMSKCPTYIHPMDDTLHSYRIMTVDILCISVCMPDKKIHRLRPSNLWRI